MMTAPSNLQTHMGYEPFHRLVDQSFNVTPGILNLEENPFNTLVQPITATLIPLRNRGGLICLLGR